MDLGNPKNFYHDVCNVAGLVQQFFKELPDPVLTSHLEEQFRGAARRFFLCLYYLFASLWPIGIVIDNNIQRRDSLQALINALPRAHYEVARALFLVRSQHTAWTMSIILTVLQHLKKVQKHSAQNYSAIGDLATCFLYVIVQTVISPTILTERPQSSGRHSYSIRRLPTADLYERPWRRLCQRITITMSCAFLVSALLYS